MSNFKITKNQLNLLIESLGVPDNITNVALKMFKGIVGYLSKTPENNIYGTSTFVLDDKYQISDINYKAITMKIELHEDSDVQYLKWNSAAYSGKQIIDYKRLNITKLVYSIPDSMIVLDFVVNQQTNYVSNKTLVEYLKQNETEITATLVHELKHKYDSFKQPIIPLNKAISYDMDNYGSDIPPINKFLYGVYYTSEIETRVLNSEFYYLLKQNKVKKENFKEFLYSNQIYRLLNTFRKFSIKEMLNDLETNYIEQIRSALGKKYGSNSVRSYTNAELINSFMSFVHSGMMQSAAKKMIPDSNDYLGYIERLAPKEKAYFEKYLSKYNKTNYMRFFYDKQKEVAREADNAIKNLAKLYDVSEAKDIRYPTSYNTIEIYCKTPPTPKWLNENN